MAAAPALYFHGLPGSAEELGLTYRSVDPSITVLPPFEPNTTDKLAGAVAPARVIGFSLGAFSALRFAAMRPDLVSELVLIAPAAPFIDGVVEAQMAGAPLFRLAQKHPWLFASVTALQGLAASFTPQGLLRQMFAGSCDADRALLEDPNARSCLIAGLRNSLINNTASYRRVVSAYVRPWDFALSDIECPCTLYHGELDTWVPLSTAEHLASTLPNAHFHVLPGLGHHSTLARVLADQL